MPFTDRSEAGRRLTAQLQRLRRVDADVLGPPRNAVPVAFEAARGLGAPLDVIVVRELGLPRPRRRACQGPTERSETRRWPGAKPDPT